MDSKEDYREELKLHWEEFVGRCTTHGIINIHQNKAIFYKIVWIFLFLTTSTLCFYLVVSAVVAYLEYEVTTRIRIKPNGPIDFPTIRICDASIYSTKEAKQMLIEFFYASGLISPLNLTYMSSNVENIKTTERLWTTLKLLADNYAGSLNNSEKKKLSVELNKMLISCHFGDKLCSAADFSFGFSFYHGNCYSFNSGLDSNDRQVQIIQSKQQGQYEGFQIELLLPPSDAYYLNKEYGVRVFIGDASIEPTSFEEVYAAPGTKTIIGIKKTVSESLPYPYSDCNSDPNYNRMICLNLCYDPFLKQKCGCGYYAEPICKTLNETICDMKNYNGYFQNGFLQDKCASKCTSKCEQTSYDLTTSSLVFPSDNYAKNIIDNKDLILNNFSYSIDFAYLKKNMISLNVYWKKLGYTLVEESPTTTELDLISNIGGLLGKKHNF
jgi:hypothetical protein